MSANGTSIQARYSAEETEGTSPDTATQMVSTWDISIPFIVAPPPQTYCGYFSTTIKFYQQISTGILRFSL